MSPAASALPLSRPSWLLLPALLLAAWLLAAGSLSRPFHADEAGQWSLAVDGAAHSRTGDRFHGPSLGLLTQGVFSVLGADLSQASEGQLRAIPLALGLSLLLLPWVFPSGRRSGLYTAVLFLPAALTLPRFIQEPLLAVALVWSAVLWVRAGPEGEPWWRFLAGLFAGLALACKVTAALHLGLAAIALLILRRSAPGGKGLLAFMLGLLGAWVLVQSSFLTDLPALGTWWNQFFRAFGVASGASETPLPMGELAPWVFTGMLLLTCLGLRLVSARDGLSWGDLPQDFILLASGAAYLLHLSLPYQTSWLLMTPDMLLLLMVLPVVLSRAMGEGVGLTRRLLALPVAVVVGLFARPDRYDYVETHPDVPALCAALQGKTDGRPSLVLVQGDHLWPFPFYLRDMRVAYGAVPDASQAEVWLMQAQGTEAPSFPGRRAIPFEVRRNDIWWALAREPWADKIEASLKNHR